MSLTRISILLILTLLFVAGSVSAQRPGPEFRRPLACEPIEPRTKLEAIEWRYERVLVKGFSQMASFTARGVDVRVDAIELKDTQAATRAIGLVIVLRELRENGRENRSLVDYE